MKELNLRDSIESSELLCPDLMDPLETIDIPGHIMAKWQNIVDMMAELIEVPVALIARVVGEDIQIFVASQTSDNPYKVGDTHVLCESGLFCETVINCNAALLVPDALSDPLWQNNPDIELNLISYLGFPIVWPNKKVFGTVCVLDRKRNAYSESCKRLMAQFRDLIEHHLMLISTDAKRREDAALARRRYGDALQTSEARLFRVLESAHLPTMVVTSEDLRIININDAFMAITGYTNGDVIGRVATELDLWADDAAYCRFEQALDGAHNGSNFEIKVRGKDGSMLDCLMSAESAFLHDKHCVLVVLHDITEHKKSELELIKAVEAVMRDPSWFSHSLVEKLAEMRWSNGGGGKRAELSELTPRERDVLGLLCEGMDDTEIADYLNLSRNTIRNHVAIIYNKLNVHRRSAVIVWARERGIVRYEKRRLNAKET